MFKTSGGSQMEQWEYLVDRIYLNDLDKRLASAGSLGWELVVLTPNDRDPAQFLAVFKKPSAQPETDAQAEETYDPAQIKPDEELPSENL